MGSRRCYNQGGFFGFGENQWVILLLLIIVIVGFSGENGFGFGGCGY